MIELNNVTKRYFGFKALCNVSIRLDQGRIIGLIGENGSGKTTLLKMLTGLLRPSVGQVKIDGEKVDRRISKKLAYLTDMDYYFPFFTVNELICFYESQFEDYDKAKALEVASSMKLNLMQKIKHLSKGNRSRLKIAVTLARNARYIVLDEPFSGLDPMVRKSIINGVLTYVDLEKQTVILATHELNEVEPILDEVVLLKEGEVIAHHMVDEIRENHQMNIIDWMEKMY